MNLANELIRIAKDDIKSSQTLYADKQYRNAVYLFQQASEKTTKAIGCIFGGIKDEIALRKIGHNSEKMYLYFLDIAVSDAKYLTQNLPKNNPILTTELQESLNSMVVHFESQSYYQLFGIENLKKYTLKDLEDAISFLETLKPNSKEFKNEIVTLKKVDLSAIDLVNVVNSFSTLHNIEQINKEDTKLMEFIIKTFFPIALEIVYPLYVSFICSIIMKGHVANTRYPTSVSSPSTYYTFRLPLVKKLPELTKILRGSIISLERTAKKLNNLTYK